MYTISTKSSFDSAHFLSGYQGKCSNIHGHRWTVSIEIGQELLETDNEQRGMIVDFSKIKNDLKNITETMDHCLIIENGTLKQNTLEALEGEEFKIVQVEFRPTAENFSKYFYDEIKKLGYKVISATVYETPNNYAKYS